MKITLRQLEVFVMIAKHGNMTRAAEELYLSQSACSMALTTLEDQLGGELFDRHNKNLILNDCGKLLFSQAANMMTQVKEIQHLMKTNSGKSLSGSLKVGSSTTIGGYVLPKIIIGFMNLYTQTKIHLSVSNTAQIIHHLLDFDIDIGFIEGSCSLPEVEVIPWKKDELIIIGPSNHYLSRKRKITRQHLEKEKWIFREKGSGTRELFEKNIANHITPYVELGHTEAIKQAIEAGMGISCISKVSVEKNLQQGSLTEIKTPPFPLTRDFYMIIHKHKYKSPLLDEFINFAFSASG